MARSNSPTASERLLEAADELHRLAEEFSIPSHSMVRVQMLHDRTEQVAADVRAVVRGPTLQR